MQTKIAETLRLLRIQKGLTQEALSKELNISRQVYSYYENGKRLPDLITACMLADYYHISLDKLVLSGLRPNPVPPDVITGLRPKPVPPDKLFEDLLPEHQKILNAYQRLSPEDQKCLRSYLEFLDKKEK